MREAWGELRDELLQEWIAENPGTRPWAWWKIDAPERRRRIDGKPHPFDVPERIAHVAQWALEYPGPASSANRLTFGKPSAFVGYKLEGAVTWDDCDAEYEEQLTYLRRLDLLTSEELQLLVTGELPNELISC